MPVTNRRSFFRKAGLGLIPAFLPFSPLGAVPEQTGRPDPPATREVKFFGDGEMFSPEEYLLELGKAQAGGKIIADRYGSGGAVAELEKRFAAITGKEAAVFMPSGTMANQLALSVLSGSNTKVFLQETSHIYRDEADAAQSVFGKRLMPLAPGEAYFTAAQLTQAIENLKTEEVFPTGIGAVSVENPVRRANGRVVPIEEIRRISSYCRGKNIPLHLDGARLFLASGWTGVGVKEYATYFDTVYISLYKYFGAGAGAILCGPKNVLEKMPHLIKVHGGSLYQNWMFAAMALHRMEGFEARLQEAIRASAILFKGLNSLPGVSVTHVEGGTNMYRMKLAKEIDGRKLQQKLGEKYGIRIPRPDDAGEGNLSVNETILYKKGDELLQAFRASI